MTFHLLVAKSSYDVLIINFNAKSSINISIVTQNHSKLDIL